MARRYDDEDDIPRKSPRGGRKGKGRRKDNNQLLFIGLGAGGGLALIAVLFVMFSGGGGAPLPPPPGNTGATTNGQANFTPGGSTSFTRPPVNNSPNTKGSRFDQPITTGSAPKNLAAAPAVTGPKNPNLGVGLGNFVGVTSHWKKSQSGKRDSAAEFKTLQESPDQLPPDFWSVGADPPENPVVFEPKKKTVRVKVPIGSGNRRATTEDIIFPVVQSPFVAVGTNAQKKDNREIWNLGTGEKLGTITGLNVETFDGALSPDGRYFAAFAGRSAKSISVYDVEEKKPLGELEASDLSQGFATLAIPKSNLIVAVNSWGNQRAHVWSLPAGDKLHDIELGWNSWNRVSPVFSPGGRFMAQARREHMSEEIWIHELETAQVVGKLSMPSYDIGWGLTIDGLAFSHDGNEIAAIVNGWSCSKILIWKLADGSLVDHMTFPTKLKEIANGAPRNATPLSWFPNGKRFLAFELAIVDRDMGTVIWQIPKSSVDFSGKRRALDNSFVTVIDVSGNSGFVLVYELPEERIKQSAERIAKTATSKKEDYPQVLGEQPQSVPNDFSATKFIVPAEVPWGVQPDPIELKPASTRPLPLTIGGAGTLREIAVSRGESPRAVALRSNANDPFGRVANGNITPSLLQQYRFHSVRNAVDDEQSFSTQGSGKERAWVDIYDVATGKQTLQVRMKKDGDLMGLSPDGSRFLCWAATTSGRLDLYSTEDGKPIVGWNPYASGTEKDAQTLVAATLIDAQRAMTMNAAGRLYVWQLPEVKATIGIDNVSQPALSPNSRYLSYSDGSAYYFVELSSGELKGKIPDVGEVNAAAYHPSGEKLALLSSHKGAYYLFSVDLKTGVVSPPFPVPILSPFLHWCGDRYVLLDNQRLVDIEQRVVAWTYELPEGDHLPTSPDGRHWIVGNQGGKPVLLPIRLPNAAAESELNGIALSPEFALQPGGKCSLEIQLGSVGQDFAAELEKKVREQLAANKITIEPGQPVTLKISATETAGEAQKRTYNTFGRGGSQEVTFTPKAMACSATFAIAGGTGWENTGRIANDAWFIQTSGNQTIEQAIQSNYTASVKSWFNRLVLPPYVFTPKSAYGVGKSPLGGG